MNICGFLKLGDPSYHLCFKTKSWSTVMTWMIRGYHHFRKPPFGGFIKKIGECTLLFKYIAVILNYTKFPNMNIRILLTSNQ